MFKEHIQQLNVAVNTMMGIVSNARKHDDVDMWAVASSLVFSNTVNGEIHIALRQLGTPLQYNDPNLNFKADLIAYSDAVVKHATIINALFKE